MGQSPPGHTYNENGLGLPFFQGTKDFGERFPAPRVYCTAKAGRVADAGDVLLSVRAPIGRTNVARRRSMFGRGIASIRCRDPQDQRFIELVLRNRSEAWRALEASGSVFGNAKRSDLEGLLVYWPSESERVTAAAILSAYDDLIENSLRRIEILEEMARNLYREWFVEFRFPGHERVRFVDSPLGRIPEGWRVAKLRDLVDTQYGYTESAQSDAVGPRYLRGMDINKRSFIDWSAVPYCPIDAEQAKRFRLAAKDVVVVRMADPGKAGIVEEEVDAVFASYLVRLLPKDSEGVGGYYLFYFLDGDAYGEYIARACTGTTRKSASAGTLTGVNIVVPPPVLLGTFEEEVGAIRGLLTSLVRRNVVLRQARDLLLPKLISGEVDVSDLPVRTRPLYAGDPRRLTRYRFFRDIVALPFVEKIAVFGSRARGDHEERSDIDLCVFCGDAGEDEWSEVLACLEPDRVDTLLKVDCTRFETSNAALRENVLTEGIVLFERGEGP